MKNDFFLKIFSLNVYFIQTHLCSAVNFNMVHNQIHGIHSTKKYI